MTDYRQAALRRAVQRALVDFQVEADAAITRLDAATAAAVETQLAAQATVDQLSTILGRIQVQTAAGQVADTPDPLLNVLQVTATINDVTTSIPGLSQAGYAALPRLLTHLKNQQAYLVQLQTDPTANADEIVTVTAGLSEFQMLIAKISSSQAVVYRVQIALPTFSNSSVNIVVNWPSPFPDSAYVIFDLSEINLIQDRVHVFVVSRETTNANFLAFKPPNGPAVTTGAIIDLCVYRLDTP